MNYSDPRPHSCHQCGAVPRNGRTCLEKYHEMLALEFQDPTVFGAVHHITVTCYNLQHPDFFSEEALTWMRSSLRAVIEDGLSSAELLKKARTMPVNGIKVRRRTSPVRARMGTQWSMTVMDIRTEGASVYTKDIASWAKSILEDIDAQ